MRNISLSIVVDLGFGHCMANIMLQYEKPADG